MHGEIIATGDELHTVLRSLRSVYFHVLYIRSHFIGEHPGFYFVGFWETGGALDIAHSLRSTLEAQIGFASALEISN